MSTRTIELKSGPLLFDTVSLVIGERSVWLSGGRYLHEYPTWYKWPWRDLQKCVILAMRRFARDEERAAQGKCTVDATAAFAIEAREVLLP